MKSWIYSIFFSSCNYAVIAYASKAVNWFLQRSTSWTNDLIFVAGSFVMYIAVLLPVFLLLWTESHFIKSFPAVKFFIKANSYPTLAIISYCLFRPEHHMGLLGISVAFVLCLSHITTILNGRILKEKTQNEAIKSAIEVIKKSEK